VPVRNRQPRRLHQKNLLERASELAFEGRKLAIYDRETGLFSTWFVELRCAEECYRAARYGRPLSLMVVDLGADAVAQEGATELAKWLLAEGRRSDLPAYLGSGRFAVLMPETDAGAAHGAIARICQSFPGADGGVASYPYEGGNLDQLKASALRQLAGLGKDIAA